MRGACILLALVAASAIAQDAPAAKPFERPVFNVTPEKLPVLPVATSTHCGTIKILPVPADTDFKLKQVNPDTSKLAPMPQAQGLPSCQALVPKLPKLQPSK
jgi:hypothetical protein